MAIVIVACPLVGGFCSKSPPPPPTLVLESPSTMQIFQRDDSGYADIFVRAKVRTAVCTPVATRMRWANGQTVENQLPGPDLVLFYDRIVGNLSAQHISEGSWGRGEFRLEVDCAEGSTHVVSAGGVGVGDWFVLAGQSNMRGAMETLTVSQYAATTLYSYNHAFGWAADSLYVSNGVGSIWPGFADKVYEETDAPVGLIPAAVGATGLVSPPDWAIGGDLWNAMLDKIHVATSGQMKVRAVLWFQGESDAGSIVLGEDVAEDYEDALIDFGDALQSVLVGRDGGRVPFVVGVLGPIDIDVPEYQSAWEAIRQVQRDAASESANVDAGPETEAACPGEIGSLYPCMNDYGIHFNDPARAFLIDAWWDSVELACY